MTLPKKKGTPRNTAKLSETERAFCLHYVGAARGIATHALRMTGHKSSTDAQDRRTAYVIMQRPRVIAEIDRLRAQAAARMEITAEDVLVDLVRVRDKARLLPPTSANLKVELSAIEKIGDHVGVMAFRKQLGLAGPEGGPIQVEDLSNYTDEELDELERARSIIDRRSGVPSEDSDEGSDPPGA